jgi:hypothetical protein
VDLALHSQWSSRVFRPAGTDAGPLGGGCPRSILVCAVGTEDGQDAEHCALHRPAVARESVSPPDDLAVAGGRLLRHVLPPEVFAATHIHGLAHGLIELSLAGPTTQAQAPEGWSPAA